MTVYKTTLDVDSYRSLLAKDPAVHNKRLLALDGSARSDYWEPLQVEFDNRDAPMPSIISCGAGNMVLWGRSLEVLGEPLVGTAELLPVIWEGGNGFLVNVLGLTKCLNANASSWCVDQDSGKRLFVNQHVFDPAAIPSTLLFRIPEQRFAMFTADHDCRAKNLLSLVNEYDLTGLSFDESWKSE